MNPAYGRVAQPWVLVAVVALRALASLKPGVFVNPDGSAAQVEVRDSSGFERLDKAAGPVGEALVMTAIGLAVAIPAVLAYNAFSRNNRLLLAELDGFAHDLFAFLSTGHRLAATPGQLAGLEPAALAPMQHVQVGGRAP